MRRRRQRFFFSIYATSVSMSAGAPANKGYFVPSDPFTYVAYLQGGRSYVQIIGNSLNKSREEYR